MNMCIISMLLPSLIICVHHFMYTIECSRVLYHVCVESVVFFKKQIVEGDVISRR